MYDCRYLNLVRWALLPNVEDWQKALRIWAAVLEMTRPGDLIYFLRSHDGDLGMIECPAVLRPCEDEISAVENLRIVEKLLHKGCDQMGGPYYILDLLVIG
jgi:hypothetical protein